MKRQRVPPSVDKYLEAKTTESDGRRTANHDGGQRRARGKRVREDREIEKEKEEDGEPRPTADEEVRDVRRRP